jgi:hypothetical protein
MQPDAITDINLQGQLIIADAICNVQRGKKPDLQELFN